MKQGIMTSAIIRRESDGTQYFEAHSRCKQLFHKVGWLSFSERIQGYNEKATRVFVENFDGKITRIGNLDHIVSEDSIAAATALPHEGELWFKGMRIKGWN
jgi:hypothetical protein